MRACSTCCKPAFIATLALAAAGCFATGTGLEGLAKIERLEFAQIDGRGFTHAVAWQGIAENRAALHVYIEGDGRPWLRGRRIARDPTPDHLLMFELMRLDPAPALYLGRPCYHGHSEDAACRRELWSGERYSAAIVDSLVAALERVTDSSRPLVLIGHSGGGTLAMLIAARLPRVDAVLTLNGNLDPDAWTAYHGYSPLRGSLNPTRLPPLPPRVRQVHIAAGQDTNIPARIIEAAAAHQQGSLYRLFPRQAHDCCWASAWPEILSMLPR